MAFSKPQARFIPTYKPRDFCWWVHFFVTTQNKMAKEYVKVNKSKWSLSPVYFEHYTEIALLGFILGSFSFCYLHTLKREINVAPVLNGDIMVVTFDQAARQTPFNLKLPYFATTCQLQSLFLPLFTPLHVQTVTRLHLHSILHQWVISRGNHMDSPCSLDVRICGLIELRGWLVAGQCTGPEPLYLANPNLSWS